MLIMRYNPFRNKKFDYVRDVTDRNSGYSNIAIKNILDDINLTTNEDIILANASIKDITVNLPDCSKTKNKIFTVKKLDSSSNSVIIKANYSQKIDGQINKVIVSQWASISFISNGVNWYLI